MDQEYSSGGNFTNSGIIDAGVNGVAIKSGAKY